MRVWKTRMLSDIIWPNVSSASSWQDKALEARVMNTRAPTPLKKNQTEGKAKVVALFGGQT